MDWKIEEISKEQAAIRQLNEAIRLFFERRDMLAVHTLTGAAMQILMDLGKPRGLVSPIRSERMIKAEYLAEWNRALNATQNFLKHADRDPTDLHKFVEEGTVFRLAEALELGIKVLGTLQREWAAFRGWFAFAYPDLIRPEVLKEFRAAAPADLDVADRAVWARWLREGA